MNRALNTLLFFSFIPFVCLQELVSLNPIPIVVYASTSTNIQFSLSNSQSSITYTLHCEYQDNNLIGYAGAILTNSIVAGNGATITFSIPIQSPTVGRVRPIVCSINNPIRTVIQYLSVKPAISLSVCGAINIVKSGVTSQNVVIPVKFSEALTAADTVTCTSSQTQASTTSVAIGDVSATVTMQYSNLPTLTTDSVTCRITNGAVSTFTITFQDNSFRFNPPAITTSLHVIQLNFVSNSVLSSDLTLTCSIVTDSQTPCSVTSTSAAANWTLTPTQPVLRANGAPAVSITMTRFGIPSSTIELYYVLCCTTSNNRYVATVNVNNSGFRIPGAIASGTETQYVSDVRFSQLSTCPCDLTVDLCDPNCCCDSFCDCSGGVVPIPGPYGGFFNDPLARSCQYRDVLTTSAFHSVMCVQNESPNIIGDYFQMQSIIRDLPTFSNVLSSSTRASGFQIISPEVSGSPVSNDSSLIPITANLLSLSVGAPRFLYLPKQAPNSDSCLLTNPIVLFQPYNSSCSFNITITNCDSLQDPRLSSQFYLMSSPVSAASCPRNAGISAIQGNIPVFSFYYSDVQGRTLADWDNGYTAPATPKVNGNLCENVVKSVSYTIYYNNTGPAFISASIVLANVSMNTALNQLFSVSFVYSNVSSSVAASASFVALQSASATTASGISGLYGYDDGKPIRTTNNKASPVFSTIKTLSSTPSGICSTPLTNEVLFRQSSLTQCKFNLASFANCDEKRTAVFNYLNSVLNNSFVAVYGNPSSESDFVTVSESSASSTFMSTPSGLPNLQSNIVPLNNLTSFCTNIPTSVVITIFYTRQGKDRNEYIHNIVGVVKSFSNTNIGNFVPYGTKTDNTNLITLTSFVEFDLISAGITGASNTDDRGQTVCSYDICINELFYPWIYNYEGKQGFYEQAFGVFLLGLAIFLLVTTHPWW